MIRVHSMKDRLAYACLFADAAWWFKAFVSANEKYSRMLYEAYIRSKAWQSKRLDAMQRAGDLCEHCRLAMATQVHHKTYDRIGDEKPDDLMALCNDCHCGKHGLADPFIPLAERAKQYQVKAWLDTKERP